MAFTANLRVKLLIHIMG